MSAEPALDAAAVRDSLLESIVALLIADSGASGGAIVARKRSRRLRPDADLTVRSATRKRIFRIDDAYVFAARGAARPPSSAVLGAASAALEARREREHLRVRAARLAFQTSATLEINRAICSVGDLDQLLTLVADRCRDLLRCDVAGFALLEEPSKTIVWRAMSGGRTETYRRVRFSETGGVAGRAMTRRAPVIVRDFLSDERLDADEYPISFAEGLRSAIGVPLEIAKRPRGCLMVGHRRVHAFTGEEIDALTTFASQAAIAVENAELYERVRREQARVESVVHSINEGLILADLGGTVTYVNRQAHDLFRLAAGECIAEPIDGFIARVASRTPDSQRVVAELSALDRSRAEFPSHDIILTYTPKLNVRLTHFTVYDSGGEPFGRGFLCRDITFEKQVDAMKTEVISLVSHEIRTPLASIRGYASALLDETRERSPSLVREYLGMIDTESARLDDLVRNLTDVSKLDAGVLDLEMNEIGPAHLLRRVAARWQKTQSRRRFTVTADERIGPIAIDYRRIEQVLDNLLSNAVKYSALDSPITLELEESADAVTFSVCDEGVGIPAAAREHVFDRFYRVPTGRRKHDGSGLGLYISRGIVSAHGGDIWLAPQSRGTTVRFSLPRNERPQ